jgi:hypothetical protein
MHVSKHDARCRWHAVSTVIKHFDNFDDSVEMEHDVVNPEVYWTVTHLLQGRVELGI